MEKTFLISQLKVILENVITFVIHSTGCLLYYNFLKNYCKMIAIYLSKQQALDADSKAIQQIYFTGNLERQNGATMFFITEEAKETILDFSHGTVRVL